MLAGNRTPRVLAAIDVVQAHQVVLLRNTVAGSWYVGFSLLGGVCTDTGSIKIQMENNEVSTREQSAATLR